MSPPLYFHGMAVQRLGSDCWNTEVYYGITSCAASEPHANHSRTLWRIRFSTTTEGIGLAATIPEAYKYADVNAAQGLPHMGAFICTLDTTPCSNAPSAVQYPCRSRHRTLYGHPGTVTCPDSHRLGITALVHVLYIGTLLYVANHLRFTT